MHAEMMSVYELYFLLKIFVVDEDFSLLIYKIRIY